MSADSQDSDDKSVVSLHSNVAIVSGRINPHKVLDALRAKLRREGKSVEEIEFELKCRMSPEEVKTEHHRRREIANRAIMKKKKAIDDAKERERRKMDLRGARPRRVPRRSGKTLMFGLMLTLSSVIMKLSYLHRSEKGLSPSLSTCYSALTCLLAWFFRLFSGFPSSARSRTRRTHHLDCYE